jgi:hypothetical protein
VNFKLATLCRRALAAGHNVDRVAAGTVGEIEELEETFGSEKSVGHLVLGESDGRSPTEEFYGAAQLQLDFAKSVMAAATQRSIDGNFWQSSQIEPRSATNFGMMLMSAPVSTNASVSVDQPAE